MVRLILHDFRSGFIAIIHIPLSLSLLAAAFAVWISEQSVNLMTLGRLALRHPSGGWSLRTKSPILSD